MGTTNNSSNTTPTILPDTGGLLTTDELIVTGLTAGSSVSFVGGSSTMALHSGDANSNVIIGTGAGNPSLSGTGNTALGITNLHALTTGSSNCAIGAEAGFDLTTGNYNTLLGTFAGDSIITGSDNICVGYQAGLNYVSSESDNLIIGNPGVAAESNVLRIGTTGTGVSQQSTCYIAAINGVSVTGAAVIVATNDQLGITVSSEKFKKDIQDMGDYSSPVLAIRPVTFRYKNGSNELQRGLIAEEVEKIMPDMVINNEQGEPLTIRYHELSVLLLNELQKALKRIDALEAQQK